MKTIALFGKALPSDSNLPFKTVNEKAIKMGYLVHPDVCNVEVYTWLDTQKINYNSTFYKDWNDVISKSRFELFVDQIIHYISTYGTDYQGNPYVPNEGSNRPDFTNFKTILPITAEEVISRCEKMLFAGIALKQETIESVLDILNDLRHEIDIKQVRNKEAKMFLYKKLNKIPVDPVEMVRFLVYLATDKTLLIKDKATIDAVKAKDLPIKAYLDAFGYEKLSSVFYRFKPLFLAFRTRKPNKIAVNKLRRLAVENHKPLEKGYFEQLLSDPKSITDLPEKLKTINNFKKTSLLQTINVRTKNLGRRVFVIRNQKIYIKDALQFKTASHLQLAYDIIYKDLVRNLKSKATTICLPKQTNLTIPVSEKSFVGNYPLGTSFDFSKSDNIVGINWKGVEGAQDIDLKLITIDGQQFGWNAEYYNRSHSIVYSGDMTSANPEATELFYASKEFTPAIVKVNLYNGETNAKFKFFLAREKVKTMTRGYMVDPNNIIVNVDCVMDSKEKSLGVITDKMFILAQFRTGKGKIAGDSVTNKYTEYALATLDCYLSLDKLLKDSGFTIVDSNAVIDFTEISKDSLISLLS